MIKVSIEPQRFVAGRDSELMVRFANVGSGPCTDIVFKLGLPPEFLLLRGRNRIEIPKLRAGEDYTESMLVQPTAAGTFAVSSTNFSYRNDYGTPVRVSGFRTELPVSAPVPASAEEPPLRIAYAGGSLVLGEWDVLRIAIQNAGESSLGAVALTVAGPVRVAAPGPQVQLPGLAIGERREVSFIVFPDHSGQHVPIEVRTSYADESGRSRAQTAVLPVVVRRPAAGASRAEGENTDHHRDTILYLAASPTDMPSLRSDKEMREIREELQLGRYRDRFKLEACSAARLRDIGQALVDYKPRIVHFSGHGERDGSLYVEDELGYSRPASPEGLAALFRLHATTVDCVIVNACHTMLLAEAMTRHINHVIAMRGEIGDAAAITFSIGFYQGLAGGVPVTEAFDRGCAFLLAQPGGKEDYSLPALLKREPMASSHS